jgi:26S proteasome regulatory subunit N3
LRHNFDAQTVLLNLLLRNYLHYNLYDQAEKLANRTEFLEHKASTNEAARYHYYVGRINAIQLSYTSALNNLQKALRKGPREGARGFRAISTKFLIIVQLLLGEIPERALFRTKGVGESLAPYLRITQSVRSGSVTQFQQVLAEEAAVFKDDDVHLLVQRLRHNVIKTGLKKICTSYSRISFRDICLRLHLESETDAEYIVAKAIRDGIIDATINHSEGYIQSGANIDIYSTSEPQKGFHVRIDFCNQIHNDAVQAMRYPPDSWKQKKPAEKTGDLTEESLSELLAAAEDEDGDD